MKRIFSILFAMLASIMFFSCQAQTKFKSLDNNEFAKALRDTTVQLVDVRTAAEFSEGHIPNALNIDVLSDEFMKKSLATLNKKHTVAVYCRSGRRSKNAAIQLSDKGFKVIELNTGFSNWNGATSREEADGGKK